MLIEDTQVEGLEIELRDLDLAMNQMGFIRWAWDYKRATYDYKYVDHKTGQTYYIRVPSWAIEGEIEDSGHAVVKIGQPYIGVYTFPHGVAYDREIPQQVINFAKQKLEKLSQLLKIQEEEQPVGH